MPAAYPLSFSPSHSRWPRLPFRGAAVLVAGLHIALVIALLQMPSVQKPLRLAVLDAAPLMVSLLMPPVLSPGPALATLPQSPPSPTLAPVPAIDDAWPMAAPQSPTAVGSPTPATNPGASVTAVTAVTPATAAMTPNTITPPAAAPPPPAPVRKQVTAAAMSYLVPPPAEVPLASRRAGESGVVWLRVVVDVQGLPAQVQVQRSSGYPRLDAQAVAAMRQARFRPHTEGGQAVEVEVLAPIEYPSE